ncbi:MAG: hypothetical protein K6G50_00450 [bacterium]|nr:hypothetical protein [bacterium]
MSLTSSMATFQMQMANYQMTQNVGQNAYYQGYMAAVNGQAFGTMYDISATMGGNGNYATATYNPNGNSVANYATSDYNANVDYLNGNTTSNNNGTTATDAAAATQSGQPAALDSSQLVTNYLKSYYPGLSDSQIAGINAYYDSFYGQLEQQFANYASSLGGDMGVMDANGVMTATTPNAAGGNNTVYNGTKGSDTIDGKGSNKDDNIYANGGDGDDDIEINGKAGDDNIRVDGGEGADKIDVKDGLGNDHTEVHAGGGDDDVTVGRWWSFGKDVHKVYGESGNDDINVNGGFGKDTLYVNAGAGDDKVKMVGGTGNDKLVYEVSSGRDNVTMNGGGLGWGKDDATVKVSQGQNLAVYDKKGNLIYSYGNIKDTKNMTKITLDKIDNFTVVNDQGKKLFNKSF